MSRNRNTGVLIFIVVAGVLIGSLIGVMLSRFVPILEFGPGPLGIQQFHLDLRIITLQFGFLIDLNLAGLIGIILAVFLVKKAF